jgi:hypothetical protein
MSGTIHVLKCRPEYFEPVRAGRKTFEFRHNDRAYRVGDVLDLREWTPEDGYSGRTLWRVVTYILDPSDLGTVPAYVVMAVAPEREGDAVTDAPPLIVAAHVGDQYLVTLYPELESEGEKGLGVLLADIIRHAAEAFDWKADDVMQWFEEEFSHPTDTPRRITTQ